MSLIEKQVDLADNVQPSVRVFADDVYFTPLSLAMRTVTFFNLTYEDLNPGSIIGKWSLILPNAKLLPSHIRTIHPRENMSSVVESWNRLIASHTLGLPSVTSSSGQPMFP